MSATVIGRSVMAGTLSAASPPRLARSTGAAGRCAGRGRLDRRADGLIGRRPGAAQPAGAPPSFPPGAARRRRPDQRRRADGDAVLHRAIIAQDEGCRRPGGRRGGLRTQHLRRPLRRRVRRLVRRRVRRRRHGRSGGQRSPAPAGACSSWGRAAGDWPCPWPATGLDVWAVDASAAMLDRLRAEPGGERGARRASTTWPCSPIPRSARPAASRSCSARSTRCST